MEAQSRGSVNVLVQPEQASLLAMAMAFYSSRSVNTWNSNSAPLVGANAEGHRASR